MNFNRFRNGRSREMAVRGMAAPQARNWWRLLRRAGLALLALLAVPYVLTIMFPLGPPPASSMMLWKWVAGNGISYRWTPIEEIAPSLRQAVFTAEDQRLCIHNGVDWPALRAQVERALGDDEVAVRGASTITMQTAKNLFLWPSRSIVRKALELPLALWIDLIWPKSRILEVYLNIAEFGPGIYGAEAAARHFFNRSAARLSLNQAVLLAAALPNPIVRSVGNPNAGLRRLADSIRVRVAGSVPYMSCLP
jgi:monofunctional biosynthetic peptidoglycan transglycosylase